MAAPHNKFTDEQIAELKANRHVRKVGRSFVYWNEDFKRQFWRMYKEENQLPQEILLKLGVDYHLLGRSRVQGLVQNLRKKFEREAEEERKSGPRKRPVIMTPERQVTQLRAEVEYLRQENEFLKKIVMAGKEGRR
jgi:transposase-like protein